MKAILCLLIIIFLGSCSTTLADVDNYNITLNRLETESPHLLNYFPSVSNNTMFLCDYNEYVKSIDGAADGNVILSDIMSNVPNEDNIKIVAQSVCCYNDEIYYCNGIKTYKYNIQTGESLFLFDRGENFFVSDDVEIGNGHMVWWESDRELQAIKYYSYNLSNDKTTLLAETNHFFSPYQRIKIRNGFIAYSEKAFDGYKIYGVNVSTGNKKVLVKNTPNEPIRMVYDGKTLIWSSNGKTHVTNGQNEFVIPNGGSDVDIYENHIIYCVDEIIYIYSLKENAVVFSSNDDYGDFDFCEWFSLDEENGIAAFRATNWELSEKMYPNWEYDVEPDYIFWLKIEKTR